MNWNQLLNPTRLGSENSKADATDSTRTHFQRDYDRIIFSSPFRRLQNKTQVFPLPGSVFVHNRLTHSLEVASVGRSLGHRLLSRIAETVTADERSVIGEIPTVVAAACLAHDMGNPPFGHSGEEAIRKYFVENEAYYKPRVNEAEWNDLTRFEGNANAFRLLTQQLKGRRTGGFRLSYAVLAATVKYPYSSSQGMKKFGFFQSEAGLFDQIASKIGLHRDAGGLYPRHPLVYLVEAADDICYQIMDMEDAHKLGILQHETVKALYLAFFDPETDKATHTRITDTLEEVTDTNEQISYLRALVIGKLVNESAEFFTQNYQAVMDGQPIPPLIDGLSGASASAMNVIRQIAYDKVYNHRSVVEIEIAGFQIIGTLLDHFCRAVLNRKDVFSKKVLRLLPEQYQSNVGKPYEEIMSVLDFISGMTDLYALELYRVLRGINLPGIPN